MSQPPIASSDAPSGAWQGFVELERLLAALLLQHDTHSQWPERIQALVQRLSREARAEPDDTLFVLFQRASKLSERYGVNHALSCALVCDLVAEQLGIEDAPRIALLCAALTMNLSITALQGELAHRVHALTAAQRDAIHRHPAHSAQLLRAAGVSQPTWLEVVELHHSVRSAEAEPASSAGLALLLQRVDILLAKVSPRAGRKGMSSSAAARAACLGADGRPDRIGSALLRMLGFYPPGTAVRLASGELGVVLRRGARADQPLVACVTDAHRLPLAMPLLRATAAPGCAVAAAVPASELRSGFSVELMMHLQVPAMPVPVPA